MAEIVTIAGSPAETSRSAALLDLARATLEQQGLTTTAIRIRDLPAEDLLHGRFDSPAIQSCAAQLAEARGLIVATPVYKGAYTGVLKALLDLLPATTLNGKVVLPIAIGGSAAHSLAVEYALMPLLGALGASVLLGGIYAIDSQLERLPEGGLRLDPALEPRWQQALADLVRIVRQPS